MTIFRVTWHTWFPSSSWSCQCPCGFGTVVKRYIHTYLTHQPRHEHAFSELADDYASLMYNGACQAVHTISHWNHQCIEDYILSMYSYILWNVLMGRSFQVTLHSVFRVHSVVACELRGARTRFVCRFLINAVSTDVRSKKLAYFLKALSIVRKNPDFYYFFWVLPTSFAL